LSILNSFPNPTECEFSAPIIPIRMGFSSFEIPDVKPAATAPKSEKDNADSAVPVPMVFIKDLRVFIANNFNEYPTIDFYSLPSASADG
jgi:hypothetical protein